MRPNIWVNLRKSHRQESQTNEKKVSEIAKRAYEVLKMKGSLEANLYW
jgi:hypothetical protein